MPRSLETQAINQEVVTSPRRGRSYGVYRDILGYRGRETELLGKVILDVGAGDSGFAEGAKLYGARVAQVDPRYDSRPSFLTEQDISLYQYGPPRFKDSTVAAVAQQMPFKNNSFDEVCALNSIYWMKIGAQTALKEMLRVTKDNGTLTIWPAKITAAQIEKLPSFMQIRKINPDYGCPTVLVVTKDPQIKKYQWEEIIRRKIAPMITASDIQQQSATLYALKQNKPNTTGPWRNC